MTATRTRSAVGRASRNKGATYERALAAWLREHGWPHAERGRNNGSVTTADRYDIDGTPGLLWDVKAVADRELWRVPGWLADVADDAHERGQLGVLVVKRAGHADPGRWWAWQRVGDLFTAVGASMANGAPVCLELGDLVPLLHAAGYGEPTEEIA